MRHHLWKVALLLNQSQQVAALPSEKVYDVLIVTKVDIIPHDVLLHVLLLLQLKDVAHKELLQLLIGKIYAQLLKTVKMRR